MSSKRTTFHWGTYDVVTERNDVVAAVPGSDDPDPSPIGDNLVGSLQKASDASDDSRGLSKIKGLFREWQRQRAICTVSWDTQKN